MRPIGDAPIVIHDCTPHNNSHSYTERAIGLKASRDANWAKCEFTPPSGAAMFNLDKWLFKLDEQRAPDWWTPEIEEEAVRVSKAIARYAITTEWTGSLYLSGCDLKGITLPTSVGGALYLSGCDLKGITLPTSVGGWLDLSGCDLKGITLPDELKSKVIQ
jgi:hypothetical protein